MRQRGNILFLILLAVVLFAALSYAVTSSLRGGGQDASKESAQAGASAVTQYVALLRNEVQRLMMMNGCTAANLDWRNASYTRYDNTLTDSGSGAPVSPKTGCAVFQAQGGPVSPQLFERYKDPLYDIFYTAAAGNAWRAGHAAFRWVNRKNELTDRNEVAVLFDGLDKNICVYLMGLSSPSTLFTDPMNTTTVANTAEPAAYTAAADVIDNTANLTGDYFSTRMVYNTSEFFCRIGAVILPQ